MFRCLGLHPGTDFDAWAAAALAGVPVAEARRDLEGLYDHYLLTETARGRYRFHDLIREHARALAAASPPAERDAATGRLLDYYLHAARAADQHLASRAAPGRPALAAAPPMRPITGRDDALAWLNAERLNLHAAAGYAAASGRPAHAAGIPAAMHEFLRSQGHWDQALALHQAAAPGRPGRREPARRGPGADRPGRHAVPHRRLPRRGGHPDPGAGGVPGPG